MELCIGCGKPIEPGQSSYYRKNPVDDIGGSFHSACGDPLGINAAIAAERERCAKIAETPLTPEQVAALTTGFGATLPRTEIYNTARQSIAARIRKSE